MLRPQLYLPPWLLSWVGPSHPILYLHLRQWFLFYSIANNVVTLVLQYLGSKWLTFCRLACVPLPSEIGSHCQTVKNSKFTLGNHIGLSFPKTWKTVSWFVSLTFGTTWPSHDLRLMFSCDNKDYLFMSRKQANSLGCIIHSRVILFETEHECCNTSDQLRKAKKCMSITTSTPSPQTTSKKI